MGGGWLCGVDAVRRAARCAMGDVVWAGGDCRGDSFGRFKLIRHPVLEDSS